MLHIREFAGTDGLSLRYGVLTHPEVPASGRALIYVPGLGGSVKGALDFLTALLPVFSPIYGVDLRGFGLNLDMEPPRHIHEIMGDLDAFQAQMPPLGAQESLSLCGISMGAVLAAKLAQTHPGRFSHLGMLAPAFRPNPGAFSPMYTIRAMLALLLGGQKARIELPYDISALTANLDILNDPQYTQNPPLMLHPGFLLSVRDLGRETLAGMKTLQLPTWMVIPGKDAVCDPAAMQQAFDRIPDATGKQCRVYPDYYHDVLFEAGVEELSRAFMAWACANAEADYSPDPDSSAMASSSR